MILQEIYSVITESQDVIDIMGDRLFPMRLPEGAELPASVFQVITTVPVNSLDGDSNLDLIRLQIKAWANTYTDAQSLYLVIRDAVISAASLKIVTEFIQDDEDKDTKAYCVIMQFSVWSEFDPDAITPVDTEMPYTFEGDGVTTEFIFPDVFRANSLMLFRNGVLAEKGVTYNELPDRTGVSFPVAPDGGSNPDEFGAFYV